TGRPVREPGRAAVPSGAGRASRGREGGSNMSDDYEKTFSVHVPPERAFRAFTDPNELEQWFTPKFDAEAEEGAAGVQAQAESPGGDVHFEVTQIKGDELL